MTATMAARRRAILRELRTFRATDPGPTIGDIRDVVDRREDMATMWEEMLTLERDGHVIKHDRGDGCGWRFRITAAGRVAP